MSTKFIKKSKKLMLKKRFATFVINLLLVWTLMSVHCSEKGKERIGFIEENTDLCARFKFLTIQKF